MSHGAMLGVTSFVISSAQGNLKYVQYGRAITLAPQLNFKSKRSFSLGKAIVFSLEMGMGGCDRVIFKVADP